MTFDEALKTLDGYKTLGSVYGLGSITRLMEALGRPERRLKIIHVAGTNGKGSTVTALATILDAAGYLTASYTSPEVTTYLDRFRVGLVPCSEAAFTRAFEKTEAVCLEIVAEGHPHPTIFEMELAMAVLIALDAGAEIFLQETGLGGRLDATNVVEKPILTVITAIGMDHTAFLGDTIEEIAAEKAGIIKHGVPLVAYDNVPSVNDVLRETAQKMEAPIRFSSLSDLTLERFDLDGQTLRYKGASYHYPLIGVHQRHNLALILFAVDALKDLGFDLSPENVQKGLDRVRWPGRFEVVQRDPVIILDGAHNPQAARALRETVGEWFPEKKVDMLVHIFSDKDARGILTELAPVCAHLTLTSIHNERSSSPETLEALAEGVMDRDAISVYDEYNQALEAATTLLKKDDILIVCGSLSHLEATRQALAHIERNN